MLHAVILAGGKGTRLASRLNGLPKPMADVAGVPLLERQIRAVKESGISDLLLLVNHKAEVIADFCRANDNFGLSISFMNDGEPRGTAGAMLAALPHLPEAAADLLILYGDTLFNVDIGRMYRFHSDHNAEATLFLHPNDHPQDSDLVSLDGDCRITGIHPYPHAEGAEYANMVNAAMYIARRDAFAPWAGLALETPRVIDFAKELFPRMIKRGQRLYGYNSPEYIKDMGTPARLDKAERDVASGRFAGGSLRTPKAAVFLDRDGVINREVGHLRRKEDFDLLPETAQALRSLNQSGMLSVVATNQPVIARGECSEEGLAAIHNRMDTLLGKEGAYIDRLYYCPHHPDKGFAGERSELKIACACRKPGIAMLEQARQDLNIDFTRSWLIGDRTGDMLAARNAGVRSILVRTGAAGQDGAYPVAPDYTARDLSAACAFIIDQYPRNILACMRLLQNIRPGHVVLIGGLARSGKSTLASLLRDALALSGIKAHKLSLDSFLRPVNERGQTVATRYNMDGIAALAKGMERRPLPLSLPHYEPRSRRLVPDAIQLTVEEQDVLIIEGVIALNSPDLRAKADACLYLECAEATRRERFAEDYTMRGEEAQWPALFEQREAEERPTVEEGKLYARVLRAETFFAQ